MRKTSLDCIHELARRDERVVFIGSDLGAGTLEGMRRELPERFLMEGISEAALIGMAAGLALNGKIPYVNTIATFLTRRCFEQIVDDLCLHRLPVRLIASGGGFTYAPLGPTHMAIEDLAILRAVPNITVVAPADAVEMRRVMMASLDLPGPLYVRLGKGGDPIVTADTGPFLFGRAVSLRAGSDALIVTTGIMVKPCLDAADQLRAAGIDTAVLHVPTIKPFDLETLLEQARGRRAVVSVEEHTVIGGLGSAVAEALAEADLERPPRFRRMGIADAFPDRYGNQAKLLDHHGLGVASIVSTVSGLVAGR